MTRFMTLGFILSGLVNVLGTLIFTKAFTSYGLGEVMPELCGTYGMIGIVIWGLAYLAVCRSAHRAPAIVLVFALEKLFYFITWVVFLTQHDLAKLWDGEKQVAMFFTIYGPNDGLFCLFFAGCWWRLRRTILT